MKGIRRKIGTAPDQKAAATADILTTMLMRVPDTLTGKRDKALLALGFAGAFRRSELVALDVSDLREDPEGLRVVLWHYHHRSGAAAHPRSVARSRERHGRGLAAGSSLRSPPSRAIVVAATGKPPRLPDR